MTRTDEKLSTAGIEEMLLDYFELLYTQNMSLFDRVFHPAAVLYSAQDGEVVVRSREEYRELMLGRRSPLQNNAPRYDAVLRIDMLSPEMAMAKVRLRLNDNVMVDFLNLLLVDGEWTIVAKLYHRDATIIDTP
ncbi:nuclear transport factor 2 family protein [Nocardia altamirensis]|uniref:nuclear transport factor 2 family protein n=1 Tax=Nocardia altamirensis TaxID=472158 RepID=UPI0009FD4837|nr:nuclear transport factor 2 family protein [Nocardia altamirensis]